MVMEEEELGAFASTPTKIGLNVVGLVLWLVVTGVIVAVRWVTQRGPFQRVHHEGRAISGSSPVKN